MCRDKFQSRNGVVFIRDTRFTNNRRVNRAPALVSDGTRPARDRVAADAPDTAGRGTGRSDSHRAPGRGESGVPRPLRGRHTQPALTAGVRRE